MCISPKKDSLRREMVAGKSKEEWKNVRCSMMIEMVGSSDTENVALDETLLHCVCCVLYSRYNYSLTLFYCSLFKLELKFIFSSRLQDEEEDESQKITSEAEFQTIKNSTHPLHFFWTVVCMHILCLPQRFYYTRVYVVYIDEKSMWNIWYEWTLDV